jgi:hypothetical protein
MRYPIAIVYLTAIVVAMGSWSCGGSGVAAPSINQKASLAGSMPWNPLAWNVITSSVDRQASTMSTLYGNDVAVRYARTGTQQDYPTGSVLSLVTWKQQADSHWFGANIPGQVKSVEFVSVTMGPANQPLYSYQDYEGVPLSRVSPSGDRSPGTRAAYLLSQRAAVMP